MLKNDDIVLFNQTLLGWHIYAEIGVGFVKIPDGYRLDGTARTYESPIDARALKRRVGKKY